MINEPLYEDNGIYNSDSCSFFFILIVLCLMQSKDDEGASGAIVGGSSSSFYEKNKGKTREGMLKKWTIILGIIFAIRSIALGILFMV